ncbi:hypothetical protein, partial [Brucella sp. NBRC 14130]
FLAHPDPKTASHFSGCDFVFSRILIRKPLRTFRDATLFSRASWSENRFALFGMRDNLAIRRFPFQKVPIT